MNGNTSIIEVTKAELDQAVSTLAVTGVMNRVFHEIDRLATRDVSQPEWFSSMMDVLNFCNSAEIGFSHAKAYALAIIGEHWDDVDFNIRKNYGLSFKAFAVSVTGKQWSTIDNLLRTARIWFINKVRPTSPIEVLVREPDGAPVMQDNGKPKTKFVEFEPFLVDMSKLLFMNSRANNDKMTPRLWSMLADDYFTCDDVRVANLTEDDGNGNKGDEFDHSLKFHLEADELHVSELGETQVVGTLDFSTFYDEPDGLKTRALKHMMYMLHVPDDEYIIFKEERKGKNGLHFLSDGNGRDSDEGVHTGLRESAPVGAEASR
jgi:hypothetical protein